MKCFRKRVGFRCPQAKSSGARLPLVPNPNLSDEPLDLAKNQPSETVQIVYEKRPEWMITYSCILNWTELCTQWKVSSQVLIDWLETTLNTRHVGTITTHSYDKIETKTGLAPVYYHDLDEVKLMYHTPPSPKASKSKQKCCFSTRLLPNAFHSSLLRFEATFNLKNPLVLRPTRFDVKVALKSLQSTPENPEPILFDPWTHDDEMIELQNALTLNPFVLK
jgi:hypothetical protein